MVMKSVGGYVSCYYNGDNDYLMVIMVNMMDYDKRQCDKNNDGYYGGDDKGDGSGDDQWTMEPLVPENLRLRLAGKKKKGKKS